MDPHSLDEARALLEFVDASPSPFHACDGIGRRLEAAGFRRLEEADAWTEGAGRFYFVRGASLVAWASGERHAPGSGFRIVAAHTDSPNLRIKPRPDGGVAGWRQLGVEVYGGVLLHTWLDRDLGLSGRVVVRDSGGASSRLFRVDRPVLRVPQLAIHLMPELKTEGLQLNRQAHMAPVWGCGEPETDGFRRFLAAELDVDPEDVLAWDAMCHDVQPGAVFGRDEELIAAPRLDNLASCFAGLRAFLRQLERDAEPEHVPALCFFDHEEVGSGSSRGAASPLLGQMIERALLARGGGREELLRALARSVCVSADMAHATHPNWAERHEPGHFLEVNGGPVIKINANQRYASEGETEAIFQLACERAEVPYQKWVNRTDLACGSTIGPITAANLGLRTVDVGSAQLAMHSCREMAGARDPESMVRAMEAFFA